MANQYKENNTMTKTHRSKIGLEIFVPLLIVELVFMVMMIIYGHWISFGIILVATAFSVHVAFSTFYQIEGKILKVKSGFLINREIEIASITKIRESNNPLSAPAASLDRLELFFNKTDSVLVSPKDKRGFVADLQEINPSITVTWKQANVTT
jgi:hypothetical protein